MKLFTYVAVQVGPGMSFATFHDPEALYGFSLTLCDPASALEIMVESVLLPFRRTLYSAIPALLLSADAARYYGFLRRRR